MRLTVPESEQVMTWGQLLAFGVVTFTGSFALSFVVTMAASRG